MINDYNYTNNDSDCGNFDNDESFRVFWSV